MTLLPVPAEWIATVLQKVFPLVCTRAQIVISLVLWSLVSSYLINMSIVPKISLLIYLFWFFKIIISVSFVF